MIISTYVYFTNELLLASIPSIWYTKDAQQKLPV